MAAGRGWRRAYRRSSAPTRIDPASEVEDEIDVMRVLFDVLCLVINRLIGTRTLHKIHTFPETV
ncbi:MAG TPA: hypothetical protein VHK27_09600, partial [Gammaproteobacteria bacterium]|nr:hypothetical protein [Gammaproteobacteria bacterium]